MQNLLHRDKGNTLPTFKTQKIVKIAQTYKFCIFNLIELMEEKESYKNAELLCIKIA